MKLENQVVSLESAKKMKELGYKQEGLWWWLYGVQTPHIISNEFKEDAEYLRERDDICVAPTVAELGEVLPDWYVSQRLASNNGWVCYNVENKLTYPETLGETEAEARGEMCLYLLKEGVI